MFALESLLPNHHILTQIMNYQEGPIRDCKGLLSPRLLYIIFLAGYHIYTSRAPINS